MVVLSSFFRRSLHPSLSSSSLRWLQASYSFQYHRSLRAQSDPDPDPRPIPSSSAPCLLLLKDNKVGCFYRSKSNPELNNSAICLGSFHGGLSLANPLKNFGNLEAVIDIGDGVVF
nr:hypothetical protein Itr_chr04CG26250 [Ipomoea trifida]